MLPPYEFVIVGAGLAGTTAAETLRHEGALGRILLISGEAHWPYQRPPLSKRFLTEDISPKPVALLSEATVRELDIELRLSTRVSSLDVTGHTLRTQQGESVGYRKLLIATGSTPVRLQLPGGHLPGVHYLHSLADAQALRSSLESAKQAVVIGGSFIGLEVASSLKRRGLGVTILERDELFGQLKTPLISSFFQRCFADQGVEVLVGEMPVAFRGDQRVDAVMTQGGRHLPCDMVVIGAGVVPATDFLQGSGLATHQGVAVDRFLQSHDPDVFAAGDMAYFFDPVVGHHHRVEHWDNAVKQGRLAARNMLGKRLPYEEVSYFYSQIFDNSFNLLGEIEASYERIDRGSLQEKSFAAFYLSDDVPRALFSLGRPTQEARLVETLIKHRVNLRVSKATLSDPQATLQKIPNQTLLILQGGGAFGAFECGAVKALVEAHICPDIVAGVSIGAFNGAIIASHPDRPVAALEAFWQELSTPGAMVPDESMRRLLASGQIACWGVPQFFGPRWLQVPATQDQWPLHWTSLYDTSPMRKLLLKYVDFARLKSSPIRLLVSAVEIESSELVLFDSYVDDLTPEHILASGSLPPAFPWTSVNGRHYWDGGIVSNSPLERAMERCGSAGKRVFIIDLFPGERRLLPTNLLEVMSRRDEIVYAERIRNDVQTRQTVRDFQSLVQELMTELPLESAQRLRHQPRFIQLMGEEAPTVITRIVREGGENEPSSPEYDFSCQTIKHLIEAGYRMGRLAVASSRPLT